MAVRPSADATVGALGKMPGPGFQKEQFRLHHVSAKVWSIVALDQVSRNDGEVLRMTRVPVAESHDDRIAIRATLRVQRAHVGGRAAAVI